MIILFVMKKKYTNSETFNFGSISHIYGSADRTWSG